MDELSVFSVVVDFLENRFGSGSVGRADVDLIALTKKAKVQVECKGTNANLDRAIGQCLRYYIKNRKIPIFLCVPEDYQELMTLRNLLHDLDLPIGLLIVEANKNIIIDRIAKGFESVMKRFHLCPKCGVAMSSIVSPVGEITSYKCLKCGNKEKVDSNIIAQTIDLDEWQ